MFHLSRSALAIVLFALLLAGCGGSSQNAPVATAEAPPAVPAPEKIAINSLDDLPVHTYPLQGTVSEMLDNPEALATLRAAVQADIESDLDTYLIEDAKTLQGKYQGLATLAMARDDDDTALEYLDKGLALEDKEAARLMNGLVSRSYIATKGKVAAEASAEFDSVQATVRTLVVVFGIACVIIGSVIAFLLIRSFCTLAGKCFQICFLSKLVVRRKVPPSARLRSMW